MFRDHCFGIHILHKHACLIVLEHLVAPSLCALFCHHMHSVQGVVHKVFLKFLLDLSKI